MVKAAMKLRKNSFFMFMFILVATTLSSRGFAEAAPQSDLAEVQNNLERVRTERDNRLRYELAIALAEKIGRLKPEDVPDRLIDDVASLLTSSDDAVRYWAALALAQLGPRAERAVPTLEAALRDRECEGYPNEPRVVRSLTSADGIRTALRRISGSVPESICGP